MDASVGTIYTSSKVDYLKNESRDYGTLTSD